MGAGGLLNLNSLMPRFPKPVLPKASSLRAAVFLAVLPVLSGAETTIYRFGGAGLPRPPDATRPGVRFQQMGWGDFDALKGGEATRVYMDEQVLSPWVYDPQVNSAARLWKTQSGLHSLFDGDGNSFWRSVAYECGMSFAARCIDRYGLPGVLTIEFADRVFVERIRLISGGILSPMTPVNTAKVVRNLGVSSFLLQPPETGTFLHPFQVEVNENRAPFLDVEMTSEQPVAGLQLALGAHATEREITEIEIYARGVSRLASYVADIIDFGRPAVWGALQWNFEEAAGSSVFLQTRNGEDANLLKYWRYTGIGDQKVRVTREEHDQLKRSQRAPPTYNYDSWNNWTPRFNATRGTGEPPVYPGPRRSFQFRLDFLSLEDAGTRLEFLEFRASDAAVSQVVGELAPVEVRAGPPVRFTYALKARLQDGDAGFDRVEIQAAAARFNRLYEVRIDTSVVPFETVAQEDRRLVVGLPRIDRALSDAVIEVVFDAQVLRYGAAFKAHLIDSERPFDVPQPVVAGDVIDEVFSDRVWIETSVAVLSVLEAQLRPALLTPNGDGINDEVRIAYDLVETTGGVPVEVEIRDLLGRKVRGIYSGLDGIGHFERVWDGRNGEGETVPPGIYIWRVSGELERGRAARTGAFPIEARTVRPNWHPEG